MILLSLPGYQVMTRVIPEIEKALIHVFKKAGLVNDEKNTVKIN